MVSAVIFDFYGTLARSADLGAANDAASYQTIFEAHGYVLDQAVLNDYYSRYDGVEHSEHSISEEAYEAWVRTRLRDLTGSCGVADPHVEGLVDALRDVDQTPMVAYPESVATISSLREAGLAIGVCSNWGWQLDPFLEQAGLLALIDVSVTSARAGSRKPHPGIYDIAVSAMGVDVDRNRLRRRFLGARRPRAATGRHDGSARVAGRRARWALPAGAPGRRPPRG